MGTLLTILGQFGGQILGIFQPFFTKILWPFIKKYWKIIIPVFLILGLFLYMFWQLKLKDDEISRWRNEAAINSELKQIAINTYERQALEEEKVKIENTELKKALEKSKRDVRIYQQISVEWQSKFDSVATLPPKIIYKDVTVGPTDSTDRTFNYTINNDLNNAKEFNIAGWFQTKNPFNLYIKEISLYGNIDIALNQNNEGTWFATLNTNSKRLNISNLKTTIVPFPVKWEYFYGGSVNMQGLTKFYGLESMVGIKRGSWGIYSGVGYIDLGQQSGFIFKIGIIKFGVL